MADEAGDSDLFGRAIGGQAARVSTTGLKLVHEGELVLPAAGSEAAAELVASDDRLIINYYFPVEIEIRGAGDAPDPRTTVEAALAAFTSGLQNLT